MFKLTTTKGIYTVLQDLAPADLWAWMEARAKHWKVQTRWAFSPEEQDQDVLCAFAALFSAAAKLPHLTMKRQGAIRGLYQTVRLDCLIGDELVPAVDSYANEILLGSDSILSERYQRDEGQPEVSADLPSEPKFLQAIDQETPPQEPAAAPAPVQVQAVASKLAGIHASPLEPVAPVEPVEPVASRTEIPPAEQRGAYMLAELFRSIGS